MKTILSSLAIVALSIGAANAQTTYGLKAGMNFGKIANFDSQKLKPSYFVTGFADIPLSGKFSIQPGISLQGKGTRIEDEIPIFQQSSTTTNKSDLNLMSIEIPVNAVYYVPVGNGDIFLSAGPYLGYNISGKIKNSSSNSNTTRSEDVSFSGDNKMMNRWDAGINFAVGYKLTNGLLIQAGYGLGLSNLNASENSKKFSTRTMNFGIGYQF
ncbi:porin family protein [Sphingobacterium cellulitidis]|uniref:porin family protein n=1 Tax=Sphingobacterium cellulitidis TaxID=1768011 RepID=UPI00370D5B21